MMKLKTIVIAVLCISCAAAGGHERKKWMGTKEKSDKECNEVQPEKSELSRIGSVPGKPGVDFPNFSEIPNTKFTCPDKDHVPGFYPDLDTGCQVFHVCYEHRRESFLCPVGTIFSAPLKTCDYWYSAECVKSPKHESSRHFSEVTKEPEVIDPVVEELMNLMLEKDSSHKSWKTQKNIRQKQKKSSSKFMDQKIATDSVKHTTEAPKPDFSDHKDSEKLSLKKKQHEDKRAASKDSGKTSDMGASIKEAGEIASVILKSLLPVKSKVVDLLVEQSTKQDKEKLIATKDLPKSTVKPKTTTTTTTTPKPKVVPQSKPPGIKVPVVPTPLWQQPLKKQVYPYKPVTHPRSKGLPVSLLTRKQLALNYAKLWKLKKLGNPLMGLLKAV